MSTPFTLVAKAGGADEGAENTCEAIAQVLAVAPPDGLRLAVEVDVRLSSDDVLMCIHDACIARTTNGRGRVSELPCAALQRVNAGPRGERVPRLDAVLELVRDHLLVLDVHDPSAACVRALLTAVRRAPHCRRNLLIASEHASVVHAIAEQEPMLRTAATPAEAWRKLLLECVHLEDWAPRGRSWIVPVRHRGFAVATPRFVQSAQRGGDPVWCYVVNQRDEALRLAALGVAGIFTTRPAALATELASEPRFRG